MTRSTSDEFLELQKMLGKACDKIFRKDSI